MRALARLAVLDGDRDAQRLRERRAIFSGKLLLSYLILGGACSAAAAAVEEAQIRVAGIRCSLCVTTLERLLSGQPGVGTVAVENPLGRITITASSGGGLDLPGIRARLAKAGFEPEGDEFVTAVGSVARGENDRLTFRVPGAKETYDLLEGAELRNLLLDLPGRPNRVKLRARLHHHPASLPPSLSVLSYEVEANPR